MDDYGLRSDKPHSKYWARIMELARSSPEYKRRHGRRALRRKVNEQVRQLKDDNEIR